MRVSVRSIVFVMLVMLVALGASGCFQEAGTGVQPTSSGGAVVMPPTSTPNVPPPTNTPLASNTPIVQATPTVEIIFPTAVGNSSGALVATVDQGGGAMVASSPTVAAMAMVSTATPFGAGQQLSPALLTATAILAEAIGVEQPTAAPIMVTEDVSSAPGILATEVLPGNVMLQGGEMTATAIIVEATETAYAVETLTATANGILPPTEVVMPTDTPTPTMTPDPSSVCIHEVVRGETMYSIAREYDVPLDEINRANGLTNASLIHIGDELTIPGCGESAPEPTAEPTAAESDDCVQDEYMIQPGDNLYRISLRFGVALRSLQNANNITNIHHVVAGETLVIPCE